jgi:hypothetical protein
MCLARLFVPRAALYRNQFTSLASAGAHNHSFANSPVCLVPVFFITHQSINLFINPPVCLVPVFFIIHQSINQFINPPVCAVPVFFINPSTSLLIRQSV